VGGQTASIEDFSAKISSRLPLFIGIVIGLSILLLMAVFRSIWVPLVSALFNLLSIGAAYGVVVAVFQWNWGGSLLGVGDNVPVVSFVPLMMFAILFGLSMDYNVFLLSRIREAYFEGDSPKESVVHGLSRIAKVILVAGAIMASVFAGFVLGDDAIIKQMGFGLAVAVAIDVLVLRMLIAPAVVMLLGDHAWTLPAWLDRILPNINLDGEAVPAPAPAPAPALEPEPEPEPVPA
jgi:RND superfamily putative drug exporter